jgi:hypothetical protein
VSNLVVPPRFARLTTALTRLGNPAVAEQHAKIIFPLMIAVIAPTRGYDIGGDDDNGFYAMPRTATTVGLGRELRDLRGKARKVASGKLGLRSWIDAWAALPTRTRHRLWRPRLIQTKEGRTIDGNMLAASFSAPGLHIVAPRPEVVLPAIDAELERIKKTSGAQRRRRTPNEDEDTVIKAIRNAYRTLTGNKHKGGRVIHDNRLAGRFHRLGREIDEIFGTQLFPEKDSRRLRRLR